MGGNQSRDVSKRGHTGNDSKYTESDDSSPPNDQVQVAEYGQWAIGLCDAGDLNQCC
jgi:hypothetical protein